ncbi:hypothetical protein Aph02nite_28270 [Actinoplanes philippinensis]|nr:hypothetical protein Aph02nite_28270 [Actinoplanes philippinensis]
MVDLAADHDPHAAVTVVVLAHHERAGHRYLPSVEALILRHRGPFPGQITPMVENIPRLPVPDRAD